MTNAVHLQQLPVDVSVLRMYVKNPWAELAKVRDRINELANQMAGVPFDANIITFCRVEKPIPHRGLAENVVVHDRQVISALGTMFEGDAHAFVSGEVSQR